MDDTAVSLKEYTEAQLTALRAEIDGLQALVDAKQSALALAVEKQEAAYNIRFAGVNEWRQTFGDLVSRSVTREVFDSRLSEIERRLSAIEQWQSRINGQFATWGIALTVLATAISILARFINLGN